MSKATHDLPVHSFASQTEWEAWLDEHHQNRAGIWLKFAKKGSGIESVNYAEAVESALCFGWIDGQAKSLDAAFYLQRFTPRRARSKWSKINRDKAALLVEEGRMRPSGMAQIDAAKGDGRWERAYDAPSTAAVPEDLQTLLDQHAEAAAFFESLDSRNRYAILYRIQDAKRPETRARRVDKFFEMLVRKEKLY